MDIPIDKVLANPEQPRKHFDAEELRGLAQSILSNGVIEPIIVEEANGRYILHDGERRLRASKLAGLATIPAVIVPSLNGTAKVDRLVRALVANIQRSDLDPIEEALSFQALKEQGMTDIAIANRLGISSARVAQRLKLLELDQPIQELIAKGKLSKDFRLASALLDIPQSEARVKVAKQLADRSATIKAGIEACGRLQEALRGASIPKDETPAIRFSTKKAGEINRPVWNALMQVGRVPPWPLVEIGARNVCDRCGLRDFASETTCKGCALVDMLIEMIGKSK